MLRLRDPAPLTKESKQVIIVEINVFTFNESLVPLFSIISKSVSDSVDHRNLCPPLSYKVAFVSISHRVARDLHGFDGEIHPNILIPCLNAFEEIALTVLASLPSNVNHLPAKERALSGI